MHFHWAKKSWLVKKSLIEYSDSVPKCFITFQVWNANLNQHADSMPVYKMFYARL